MWGQVLLVIFVVAASIIRLWQKRLLKRSGLQELDMFQLPILGHALHALGGSEIAMKRIVQFSDIITKQGGTVVMWACGMPVVGNTDAANAAVILKNHLDKGIIYKLLNVMLGETNSITAEVPKWRQHRAISASLFSPKNLSLFVEIFARQSVIMAQCMRDVVGRGPTPLWSYLTKYSFDAVCNTTLGINLDAQNNPEHPFLKSFQISCNILGPRLLHPWEWFDCVYKLTPAYKTLISHKKICTDFVEKVVNAELKNLGCTKEKMNHQIPTLTEMFLQCNSQETLNLQDQVDEVLTFVMAGMDTSAVGMALTLHMLAWYPDVQEKVYRELEEVFGDPNRLVTQDDLPKLQYMECVIKETMRLYPPVPIIGRTTSTNVILPSGETIPKGTFVVTSIYGIHRNPRYWGADANQFRPERFLEPFKHPKQFIPFSDGPRNCIGYKYAIMSMKTALATMLRQYAVKPASSNKILDLRSTEELRLSYGVVVKDLDNVNLCLELR